MSGRLRANGAVWLTGLLGALILATAGGWAAGLHGVWAFSALIYVPGALRLVLALLVLLAALAHRSRLTRRLALGSRHWLLLLVPLFWLLRERTFHGDALLKLELLRTQSLASDPYLWKEPLDSLLAYTLSGWLAGFGYPPEIAIAALSVLAGLLYVIAVGYVGTVLGEPGPQRWVYWLGLLALGSSQLWFGHVENYSWVTATSFAAVTLAVGYLRGRNLLWPVGLISGLALSFHPQAAFLAPALVLLVDRVRWPRQLATLALTGLIAPLLTGLGLWLLGAPLPAFGNGFAGDSQLFLTPAQAFAPPQIAAALNNLWLVAPLLPLWLIGGVAALRHPALRQDRSLRYLTGVALGLLLYHFSFQNDLPRPRDWDLFAIVGPGLTLWGLYAWLRWQTVRIGHTLTGVLGTGLTFATLFTVAWIGVNASYTLIDPNPGQRALYARYRLADLVDLLPSATVAPPEPICADATGCERVAAASFTMPQDGDMRRTIFAHAPARIALPLLVPAERSFLWLSPALDPVAWGWGGDGVTFSVAVIVAGREDQLWSRHLSPARATERGWQTVLLPLDAYRGQQVQLILSTQPGPANDDAADRAGWGLPWLLRGTPDLRFE